MPLGTASNGLIALPRACGDMPRGRHIDERPMRTGSWHNPPGQLTPAARRNCRAARAIGYLIVSNSASTVPASNASSVLPPGGCIDPPERAAKKAARSAP